MTYAWQPRRRRVAAVAALALAAAGPSGALAQKGSSTPGSVTTPTVSIQVCNNTSYTASVAASYIPVGSEQWITEGWWTVSPSGCVTVANTDNQYFYLYAEEYYDKSVTWEGSHTLCVEYPGPFALWDDGSEYCTDWQTLVGFTSQVFDDPYSGGTFTWHLDPPY